MRAVVVAAGDLHPDDGRMLEDADVVIAADGGAASLDRIGVRPDMLVGDLDSIEAELVARLEAAGTRVERHPADKDASDAELAVQAALGAGATEIELLGATGGSRLDHELANLLLLADPALAHVDISAARGPVRVTAVHAGAHRALSAAVGDLVTLLPVGGDASGVTTTGLRWQLTAATLTLGRSMGLSNEVTSAPASVAVDRGVLLIVETALGGAE